MYEGAIQDLIDELGRLPGVGPKSAQRIAFHVLSADPADVTRLANSLRKVKELVRFCTTCFNVAESEQCRICRDPRRGADVPPRSRARFSACAGDGLPQGLRVPDVDGEQPLARPGSLFKMYQAPSLPRTSATRYGTAACVEALKKAAYRPSCTEHCRPRGLNHELSTAADADSLSERSTLARRASLATYAAPAAGWMLAFRRNRLVGSYARLSAASRS